MFEDNINDRDITDALVSKKIRALYESGWFIRDMRYIKLYNPIEHRIPSQKITIFRLFFCK